jgi:uncharacterized damage-inducible protein DinB
MHLTVEIPIKLPTRGRCLFKPATERHLPIQFPEAEPAPVALEGSDGERILAAAREILLQGEDLVRTLPLERYAQRVPAAFHGSIGGHYRHCLDHFASLLRALDSDEVDYDRRERDPRVEQEPPFALELTRQLRSRLEELTPAILARPVRTRCEVSYVRGDSPVTKSTYARELVYAIAHAIHHYALISVMARLLDVTLPAHFGVAPSTVAHRAGRNPGSTQSA